MAAGALIVGTVLWTLWHTKPRAKHIVPVVPRPVIIAPTVEEFSVERAVVVPRPPAAPAALSATHPLGPTRPTDAPAFGLDAERNEGQDLDTYMSLPLETDGITHTNRDMLADLEEAEEPAKEEAFPFYRFSVLETRDPFAHYVAIGGFKLMNGMQVASIQGTKRWNPHTGETAAYGGEAWMATEQRELILKFPQPVVINRYQIRTSDEAAAFDPVRWRLEGSRNGAYWLSLDERAETVPVERSVWMNYLIKGFL